MIFISLLNSLSEPKTVSTDKRMSGPRERDESVSVSGGGGDATSAWCSSSSEGNMEFKFTWNIGDYERKKETIKRDDSIQSSTFTVHANNKKSRWYLTFLPNGAADDEQDTGHDEDEGDITMQDDVGVYLYQVSTYENYVNSLKFKISFLNRRSGEKMVVYDNGYDKKYRSQDNWGWGICDISLPQSK